MEKNAKHLRYFESFQIPANRNSKLEHLCSYLAAESCRKFGVPDDADDLAHRLLQWAKTQPGTLDEPAAVRGIHAAIERVRSDQESRDRAAKARASAGTPQPWHSQTRVY